MYNNASIFQILKPIIISCIFKHTTTKLGILFSFLSLFPNIGTSQNGGVGTGNFNQPGSDKVVESCVSGFFTFYNADTASSQIYNIIELKGQAINAVDYLEIQDFVITVPAGQDSVDLLIAAINDGIPEGEESVVLIYETEGITDSTTLFILDPPTVEAGSALSLCSGQTAILGGNLIDDGRTYQWSPSEGLSNPNVLTPEIRIISQENITRTYTLTAIDENGCPAEDSVIVSIDAVPLSTFSSPDSICEGEGAIFLYTGPARGDLSYNWDFGPGAIIESGEGAGPYLINFSTVGIQTVCLTVSDATCEYLEFCQDIKINAQPFASIGRVDDECFDGHQLNFEYAGTDEFSSLRWSFGNGANISTSNELNPSSIIYNSPGLKTVSLEVDNNGCTSQTGIEFELVETPISSFSFVSDALCKDACVQTIYEGVELGPEQTFSWEFGSTAFPNTSGLRNSPCVIYDEAGSFRVGLTVNYRGCVDSSTQLITILDQPSVNVQAGLDTSFCEGTGGVVIEAGLENNAQNVQFFWSSDLEDEDLWGISDRNNNAPSVNPLVEAPATITYFVQAIAENGCLSPPDSLEVTIKAAPKLATGPDQVICEGGVGELIAGRPATDNLAEEPFSYQWSPAIGLSDPNVPNPFASPINTTTYQLSAISFEGCRSLYQEGDSIVSVTVLVQAQPEVSVSPDTSICQGDSIQLIANASGTGDVLQFQWTPTTTGYISDSSSRTPIVSPNFNTTFSLIALENGCPSEAAQVKVEVKTRPSLITSGNAAICLGDTIGLSALAGGDPDGSLYQYRWSPALFLTEINQPKVQAFPDSTTAYEVFATNGDGCQSITQILNVTVKPSPLVNLLEEDLDLCEGDSLQLTAEAFFSSTLPASPLIFEWSPSSGIIGSNFNESITLIPEKTGSIYVSASIAGDCPSTDSVFVNLIPRLEASIFTDTTRFCEGTTIPLFARGGRENTDYFWTPEVFINNSNSQQPRVTPDSSISYQLLMVESACRDSASISLDVIPTPEAEYYSTQAQGCVSHSVDFTSFTQDAFALIWDFGDGSPVSNEVEPSHTYYEAGSYAVSLTAVGLSGCSTTLSDILIEVSDTTFARVDAVPPFTDTLFLPNALVTFTDISDNASSWLWTFGDGTFSSEQNPIHLYEDPGVYQVSLIASNAFGCNSLFEYGPYIVELPQLTIPNVFTPNGDGINDEYQMIYRGSERITLVIYDRWGKVFFRGEGENPSWDGSFLGGNIAPEGVYYYELEVGDRKFNGDLTLLR